MSVNYFPTLLDTLLQVMHVQLQTWKNSILIILMHENFIVDLHTSTFKIKSQAKWTLHCLVILEH